MKPQLHLIVTADGRSVAAYACNRLAGAGLRIEHIGTLANSHGDEHERHRPTLIGGAERSGSIARSGAHAAPHSVASGHAPEEALSRFAREACAWLDGLRKESEAARVTVFAPPKFLGLLRKQARTENAPDMHEGELSHLRASELAVHPAVVKAVAGG